ncbi:hypothetical protein FALBO_8982, partial [Fusarium albosuccineum]
YWGRRGGIKVFVPTQLGVALILGFDRMNFETSLGKPFLRKEMELKMKAICEGRTSKEIVLRESIAQYRHVFMQSQEKLSVLRTVCIYIGHLNFSHGITDSYQLGVPRICLCGLRIRALGSSGLVDPWSRPQSQPGSWSTINDISTGTNLLAREADDISRAYLHAPCCGPRDFLRLNPDIKPINIWANAHPQNTHGGISSTPPQLGWDGPGSGVSASATMSESVVLVQDGVVRQPPGWDEWTRSLGVEDPERDRPGSPTARRSHGFRNPPAHRSLGLQERGATGLMQRTRGSLTYHLLGARPPCPLVWLGLTGYGEMPKDEFLDSINPQKRGGFAAGGRPNASTIRIRSRVGDDAGVRKEVTVTNSYGIASPIIRRDAGNVTGRTSPTALH